MVSDGRARVLRPTGLQLRSTFLPIRRFALPRHRVYDSVPALDTTDPAFARYRFDGERLGLTLRTYTLL